MQQNIHPKYNNDCQVTCACGNRFITGSTIEKIELEICSNCHPFFTGQQKFADVKGRIDKFQQKVIQGKTFAAAKKKKQAKKTAQKKEK